MQRFIGVVLLIGATAAGPAWGVINNGFDTDSVYSVRDPNSGFGTLDKWTETGAWQQEILPDGDNSRWQTLTFSGSGTNDARLFVAKSYDSDGMAQPRGTIEVAELDASGNKLNSAMITAMPGGALHQWNYLGNVRYNRYHNTLMVSYLYGGDTTTRVNEIDLGLSAMQHTYVGPTGAYGYWYGHVGCDFDEETGELYLAGRHLGGDGWKGDLISFNTVGRAVGGTTNAWTELIDGSDKTTDFAPYSVIYRDRRGSTASPHPTVLLPMSDDDPDMTREFYRDQVDGNGNLLEVQTWAMNDVAMGQLDEVNGTVWMGSPTGGIWGLKANDTLVSWDTGGWPGYWLDADSPVPEPASLLLLGLGGLAAFRRRRVSAS